MKTQVCLEGRFISTRGSPIPCACLRFGMQPATSLAGCRCVFFFVGEATGSNTLVPEFRFGLQSLFGVGLFWW